MKPSEDPCIKVMRAAAREVLAAVSEDTWTSMTTITEVYKTKASRPRRDTMLSVWTSGKRYSQSGSTVTATDGRHVVVILGAEKKIVIRNVNKNTPMHDPLLSFRMLADSISAVECNSDASTIRSDIRDAWLVKVGIRSLAVEVSQQADGWHLSRIITEFRDSRAIDHTITYRPKLESNVEPVFERAIDLVIDRKGALKGSYRNYSLVDLRS